jgi:hypothetical protein
MSAIVNAVVPGVLMLASFALGAGGIWLLAKGADRKRGILMIIAALVFFGNVLILTL